MEQQLDQRLGDVIDLNAHVFSMTTRDIQHDIGKWARYNFGVTENAHFEKEQLAKMLVLIQLMGEAAHSLLKSTQGIRGNNTEHMRAWNDAMQFIGQVSTALMSDSEITQVLYQIPENFKVAPLLGVVEETGEMVTAVMDMNRPADVEDAIGDLMVFLLNLCDVSGYDGDSALKGVWNKVRQRDWKKNKENGK